MVALRLLLICSVAVLVTNCTKEYSLENGPQVAVAEGILWDSTGECLGNSVHGTFYTGITPGSDTAYVEVEVFVSKPGTYTISSDTVNGLSFSNSGTFTDTGINIINLKPGGTPIIQTTSVYNYTFYNTVCSFSINVQDSAINDPNKPDTTANNDTSVATTGRWQFTQASFTYIGNVDSSFKDTSTGTSTTVRLHGATITGDTIISLEFTVPSPDIIGGSYTLAMNNIKFLVKDIVNNKILYIASPSVAATTFAMNVTTYDAAKNFEAIFSGSVQNSTGNIVPITTGGIEAVIP